MFATLAMLFRICFLFTLCLTPLPLVSWFFGEHLWSSYLIFLCISLFIFSILSWVLTTYLRFFTFREGFLLLVVVWLSLGFFSMVPLYIHGNISLIDACFSAVSGLTTTGAEVFPDLSVFSSSLIFYRMWLQFLGGLGIVVLALAIFPVLGVGHAQSMKSDLPGPVKSTQIAPRVAESAQSLWLMYVVMCITCCISFKLVGMSWFEAVCESLGTVSTGGFGVYNDNFHHYKGLPVEITAIVFMILSSINFVLHYSFLMQDDVNVYSKNFEFMSFAKAIIIWPLLFLFGFWYVGYNYDSVLGVIFTVVSFITTSGHVMIDYGKFPLFFSIILMFLGVVGSCTGSTSGGIKLLRLSFLKKELSDAILLLMHPHAVVGSGWLGDNKQNLSEDTSRITRGFIISYMIFFFLFMLLLVLSGLDFETSFYSLVACLSNTGAMVSNKGYWGMPYLAKVVLIMAMIVGRVELLAVVVVFSPFYWVLRFKKRSLWIRN